MRGALEKDRRGKGKASEASSVPDILVVSFIYAVASFKSIFNAAI